MVQSYRAEIACKPVLIASWCLFANRLYILCLVASKGLYLSSLYPLNLLYNRKFHKFAI